MSEYGEIIRNGSEIRGVIDDGTRAIPIENKFGKLICTIHIRPGDLSIVDRYKEVQKRLPEITAPLKGINISNDGAESDKIEILKKVEKDLYDLLNYLFDMDEAEQIFATRNPFSSVGGRFFAESVIQLIGDIVSQTLEEEAKATEERTQKYLSDITDADKAED